MKQRGRKAAATVVAIKGGRIERPKPPNDLNRKEKRIFREIVESQPGGYFQPADIPLLAAYCRMVCRVDNLAAMIVDDPRDKEADQMLNGASRTMALLATKLRLCPSARLRQDSAMLRDGKSNARPWDG